MFKKLLLLSLSSLVSMSNLHAGFEYDDLSLSLKINKPLRVSLRNYTKDLSKDYTFETVPLGHGLKWDGNDFSIMKGIDLLEIEDGSTKIHVTTPDLKSLTITQTLGLRNLMIISDGPVYYAGNFEKLKKLVIIGSEFINEGLIFVKDFGIYADKLTNETGCMMSTNSPLTVSGGSIIQNKGFIKTPAIETSGIDEKEISFYNSESACLALDNEEEIELPCLKFINKGKVESKGSYTLPITCWTKENFIFNPSKIFEPHPSGFLATRPQEITGAAVFHAEGVKGTPKTHKRLTAVVFDDGMHPKYTKFLQEKGVLHPLVLQPNNPYILAPAEESQLSNFYQKIKDLEHQIEKATSEDERQILQFEIAKLTPSPLDNITIRNLVYSACNGTHAVNHGSGVMEALNLIASEALIFPIDWSLFMESASHAEKLQAAVRLAIVLQADVINFSQNLANLDPLGIEAIKDAVKQGIAVVISAGNNSISEIRTHINDECVSIKRGALFKTLKGKGILFAGSLGYKRNGEEKISDFSNLPDPSMEHRFIFAPGEDLPIRANNNPNKLVSGTSVAAPVVAGGYLLLKQYVIDNGYAATVEDILDSTYDSGHDVTCNNIMFPETYKALDLLAAKTLLDKKFGHP